MPCRLLLLLLLLLPLLVHTGPATYTVHLLYYKHNAQSEAALAELLAQLCSAFTCGEQGGQLDSVTVWGDTLVTVPAPLLGSVLPWLLQHRDGRVAGPPDTQVEQAVPGCAPLLASRGPAWTWRCTQTRSGGRTGTGSSSLSGPAATTHSIQTNCMPLLKRGRKDAITQIFQRHQVFRIQCNPACISRKSSIMSTICY